MSDYLKAAGILKKIVPSGHWLDETNRKKAVELFGKFYNITSIDGWYKVTGMMAKRFKLAGLLAKYYNGSFYKLLCEVYPDFDFKPWKFKQAPQKFWNDNNNAKLYIKYLCDLKGYSVPDDLDKLVPNDFIDNDGNGLWVAHGNCLKALLESLYPERRWHPWLFAVTTMGTWTDKENHKSYMKWLEGKLGIKSPEDWYAHLSKEIFRDNHGHGLLSNHYGNSPTRILEFVYPEFKWKYYLFCQCPHGLWKDKQFINEWAADMCLHYNKDFPHGLYDLSRSEVLTFYGNGGIDAHGGFVNLIMNNIENSEGWKRSKFIKYGFSVMANEFLLSLSKNINTPIWSISNSENCAERKVGGYKLDGYITPEYAKALGVTAVNGVAIEFDGCAYHGCPDCFPERDKKTFFSNKTYGDAFEYTQNRAQFIRSQGYALIAMRECEYKKRKEELASWFSEKLCDLTPSP
jgi:hypothetical protein